MSPVHVINRPNLYNACIHKSLTLTSSTPPVGVCGVLSKSGAQTSRANRRTRRKTRLHCSRIVPTKTGAVVASFLVRSRTTASLRRPRVRVAQQGLRDSIFFQVLEVVCDIDKTEVLTGVPFTRSTPLTVMLLVLRFTPSSYYKVQRKR